MPVKSRLLFFSLLVKTPLKSRSVSASYSEAMKKGAFSTTGEPK